MARYRRPAAPRSHDRWLISYADFITLLLALFVVMFASSQPDKGKVQRVSSAVMEALEPGRMLKFVPAAGKAAKAPMELPEVKPAVTGLAASLEYLEHALADEIKARKVEVRLDARGLVISLRQAAYFPSGGDAIAASGLGSLEKISGTIRDLPNPVELEGHTDSDPMHSRRFRSNWELSTARSIAVLRLFTGRYGIPAARFAVAGYAETRPVDTNDSAGGRARNRRVDIVILNQPSP